MWNDFKKRPAFFVTFAILLVLEVWFIARPVFLNLLDGPSDPIGSILMLVFMPFILFSLMYPVVIGVFINVAISAKVDELVHGKRLQEKKDELI